MEEIYDDPPREPAIALSTQPLPRTNSKAAAAVARVSTVPQAAIAPPSTPPAPRRQRLPSAPSIVLNPEPLVHQEATQPALRALQRGQSGGWSLGTLLVFVLGTLLVVLIVTAVMTLRH
jgi:hypothetical protein